MKITIKNYAEATHNVDFSMLPKALHQIHADMPDMAPFYYEDNDIKEDIDLYLEKLNKALAPAKKPKSDFTPKARGKKPEAKPKQPEGNRITVPFKNLADLKKRLKKGDVLYFSRQNKGVWTHDREKRVVNRVQSSAISMFTPDGTESWLGDLSAKNMDFQNEYFSSSGDDVMLVYAYTDSNPLNQPKPQSPKPEKTTKPKAEKPPKAAKPKAEKPAKQPKTQNPKPKTEKKWAKAEPEGFTYAFHIPPAVQYARRFVKMNGKTVDYDTLRKLHTGLSKAFVQGRTGSTEQDKVAHNIHEFLGKNLEKLKPGAKVPVSISEEVYKDMVANTGSWKVYPHVALLSSFFAMQGTAPDIEKAKGLRTRIEKYLNKEKPRKAAYLEEAHDALNRYANGKTDIIKIADKVAKGLDGFLSGCGCNHKAGLSGVATYQDVMKVDSRGIGLQGTWKKFLGNPTLGFALMLYGKPGHGKSTIALRFANYLAQSARVMYVNSEEMKATGNGMTISPTMADKLERSGGSRPDMHFSPSVDAFDHSDYDFVFVDSVNGEKLGYEDFRALREENPNTNYILIMQMTKAGQFRGTQEWEHEVDAVAKVEDGTATVTKNRFGAMGLYGL